MHHFRRLAAALASLALTQFTVLGSAMPCATSLSETEAHAAHKQHAGEMPQAEVTQTESARPDVPPAGECTFRACATSPVLLAEESVLPASRHGADRVRLAADEKPITAFHPPEPPPPRA